MRSHRIEAARRERILSEEKLQKLSLIYSEFSLNESVVDNEVLSALLAESAKYERLVLLEMLAGKTWGQMWSSFNGIFEALEELGRVSPEISSFVSKFSGLREEVFDALSMKFSKVANKDEARKVLEKPLADVMVVAKAVMAINTSLADGKLGEILSQFKADSKLNVMFGARRIATKQELSKMSQEPTGKVAPTGSVIPKLTNVPDDENDDYLKGLPEGLGDMFKKKFGVPGFSPSRAVDEEKKFDQEVDKIVKTKAPGAARLLNIGMLVRDLKNLSPSVLRSAFSRFEKKFVSFVDDEFLRATVMAASKTPFLKSVWDTLSGGLATRSRI